MAGHSVTLQWATGVNLSAQFNVYRSAVSGVFTIPLNVTPIAAPAAALTTYTDPTVGPGIWFYVVTILINGVESAFSNQLSVTISPTTPPAALTGVSVVASS